ncbi:MAG: Lrp/AsnC family transcriptional regulator [Acidilobaceae archaeon]
MAKLLIKLEALALDLIRENNGSIFQSELWKKLNLDSREGSRLVLRLLRKGLIRREEVMVNGRRTYRLFIVEESKKKTLTVKVKLDNVLKIPCFTCFLLEECGHSELSNPLTCQLLNSWLQRAE